MATIQKKRFITTAIAYPNGKPHMGHALEIIQADALARYYRLQGHDVVFQTGTDEHGKKNWQTAEKEGKTVLQFLDENVSVFKDLYEKLSISNDFFIRTSDKEVHYPGAQKLWRTLKEAGDLYTQRYSGLYCVGCESYKTEKDLEEGKCPDHPTRDVELIEEENYFFAMSKYTKQIVDAIEKDEFKIIPKARKNEILSFLKDAKDVSFSRPASVLPWGVPVPDESDHVMYVWCDALANYITGAGYGSDEAKFASLWPADIQVIGKDILRFHAAIWPAMLLSAKLPLPKELLVHGFLQLGGKKMGKSTGNVIDPLGQIDKYGVDCFRFYILGSIPLDNDGEYSVEGIEERIDNELVANFSNFCYRVGTLLVKKTQGKIERFDPNEPLIPILTQKYASVKDSFEKREFKQAVAEIMEISALGNKYLQDQAPWKNPLEKKSEDETRTDEKILAEAQQKASEVLSFCANLVKNLAILFFPITPNISEKILKQLGLEKSYLRWSNLNFDLKDHDTHDPEILVHRIQDLKLKAEKKEELKKETKEKVVKAKGEKKEKEKKKNQPKVDLPIDVSRLDIRVGKITSVKLHETADTLYVEEIDVGEEKPRRVVSGLVRHYSLDEMEGREVVVLCNLKPATLRGVKSEAMVLAASDSANTKVELLVPPSGCVAGERVKFEGYPGEADGVLNPKHKVFEQVQPHFNTNDDCVAHWKDVPFMTSKGVVRVPTIQKATIR